MNNNKDYKKDPKYISKHNTMNILIIVLCFLAFPIVLFFTVESFSSGVFFILLAIICIIAIISCVQDLHEIAKDYEERRIRENNKNYQEEQRLAEERMRYQRRIKEQQRSSEQDNRYVSSTSTPSRSFVFAYEVAFDNVINKLKNRYIAFDVETTGLSPYRDRIIEVGAVLFENEKPVREFGTLVNAERDVPPAASAVNHITSEMVRNAPSENDVYTKLTEFLGDALNEQTIICAHNAKFDMDFLSETLMRLGYNGKIVYIDTLPTSRIMIKGMPYYKQPTLAKYFNIENEQAHRAASDAKVCGQILSRLIALDNEKKEAIRRQAEQKKLEERLKSEELQLYSSKRNEITIDPINDRIPLNEITDCTEQDIIKGNSYWSTGENVRKSGDFDLALQLYDKARCSGYSSPELYESYALTYRRLKDYDNEIDILDEAISRYKNDRTWYEKFEIRRYKSICLLIKQQEKLNKKQEKQNSATSPKNADNALQKPKGRAVIKMNDDMEIIKQYESISEASRDTGISPKSIRCAATGIQKHAGGFVWKYAESQIDSDILEGIKNGLPGIKLNTTEKSGVINVECTYNEKKYRIRWNELNPKFDVTAYEGNGQKMVFCSTVNEVCCLILKGRE